MRKYDFDYHMTPGPNSPPLLGGSTLGSFATTYVGITARQNPPTEAQWYSEFCHRFLSLHELLQSIERPGRKLDSDDKMEQRMNLILTCKATALRLIQQRAEPALAAQIEHCFTF